jgi:N-acetylmuramoyl-L-alanine amidase
VVTTSLLRLGDRGDAVRDLQQRLNAAGPRVAVDGVYGDATLEAVRAFQGRRGLRVDGICGPETWGALIESSYAIGDRLLYLCQPMLRGDDVTELQRRLNALGFHAGREDGILGPATAGAIGAFQRDAGLAIDRVCGPATLAALNRVGSLAAGSVASVRERENLRTSERRLDGTRVFVAGDLSVAALTTVVVNGLRRRGAIVAFDTSGEDAGFVTTSANRFEAAVFLALTTGDAPGARCAYFMNQSFRSETGFCIASRLTEALQRAVARVDAPIGRTYRMLRETRMAAVVCELSAQGDADEASALTRNLPAVAAAIVDGVQRGIEDPIDANARESR